MSERPYARYSRDKTWQALYNQAINACYAIVPNSTTNNSIWLLRCKSPVEAQEQMRFLLEHEQECAQFFANRTMQTPTYLKNTGEAVILARSSDYWHYHLNDVPTFALVVVGMHDSYLHLPVWETRTNRRYAPRETALKIGSPEFEKARGKGQSFSHHILLGALVAGDKEALMYLKTLPERTQRRLRAERDALQSERYRGRPLAFYTEERRLAISQKISGSMILYHQKRRSARN